MNRQEQEQMRAEIQSLRSEVSRLLAEISVLKQLVQEKEPRVYPRKDYSRKARL